MGKDWVVSLIVVQSCNVHLLKKRWEGRERGGGKGSKRREGVFLGLVVGGLGGLGGLELVNEGLDWFFF